MTHRNYKRDFPIFENQPKLVYLDTAASALVPQIVIDTLTEYYTHYPVNIARGVYELSERATTEYETARTHIAKFIGATCKSIAFTSGTTNALNTIAHGHEHLIQQKHNIVVTAMDHHANFVPWQQLAEHTGAEFRVINVTKDGAIDVDDLLKKVDEHTAIVAFPLVSNVLGTIAPAKEIIAHIRKINPSTHTVIDAAQAAPHLKIDVQNIDCDFCAFSGHKLYGPTGIGILYGKEHALAKLTPLATGGEMVHSVTRKRSTFKESPYHLEAGTPPIAQAIGLRAAITYIQSIGHEAIYEHDSKLLTYAYKKLHETFGDSITIYGPKKLDKRSGIISFTLKHIHPHDLAWYMDKNYNIAIRAGQHCTMPLHTDILCTPATARISIGIYTTQSDIDLAVTAIKAAQKAIMRK